MTGALADLRPAELDALAASFRSGALSFGVTRQPVAQVVGGRSPRVFDELAGLEVAGFKPGQLGVLCEQLAQARRSAPNADSLVELVLSGPTVEGIATGDTAAVFRSLIEQAEAEILFVGYAIHKGKKLFERLAERMRERSDLRVVFCLDISRPQNDTSLSSEIVRRFARDFREKHWPGEPLPEVWYDPRGLEEDWARKAALHAKCVVVDRKMAFISSANFTEAAQTKNVEAGVLLRHEASAERLAGYYEGLRRNGDLIRTFEESVGKG